MKMREREILYQSDCGPVLRLSNSFIFHFIFPKFVVRFICFPKSANGNLQGFNNSDLKNQKNVSLFICKWYILKQCKTNQGKKWRCEKERSFINQTMDLFCDCLIHLFFILFSVYFSKVYRQIHLFSKVYKWWPSWFEQQWFERPEECVTFYL